MTPYIPRRMGDRINARPFHPTWSPVKRMSGNVITELKERAWEFEEPLQFVTVDTAWVLGDLVLHQIFRTTEGDKTPPMYYGNKWLWGIPFLLVGRMVSENLVKGPTWARALTIGTVANALMQGNYLMSSLSKEFNVVVFLIHQALLFPLSFLLVRDPRAPKY